MYTNVIVERQQEELRKEREREAFRYPFKITCVYQNSQNNDFPIIHSVRNHCNENNLIFTARQYDIDRFEEDADIKRLPAFHIYYKGYHDDIYYFDNDPIHQIQVVIWAYEDEQKEKERRKQRRIEQWNNFKEGVTSIFKRDKRTALDLEASLQKLPDEVRKKEGKNISPKSGMD